MSNDNVTRPASELVVAEGVPPAERSGPAIIGLLQQAADVARRNEDRAKAMAQRLIDQVRTLEQHNQALEERVRAFEERAVRAEQWLLHIYDEIHAQLIEHAPTPAADAPAERRRAVSAR